MRMRTEIEPGRRIERTAHADAQRTAHEARRHDDFAMLYGVVARRMVRYRDARLRAGACTAREADWFTDLVRRFAREFDRWGAPSADAGVNDYLASLATAPRVVRLAGHVFLHIGYDLPRIVGASFVAHPSLDRSRMRAMYFEASPLLRAASMRTAGAMHPLWLLRGIRRPRSVAALADAVQAMRVSAWVHAERAHERGLEPATTAANLMRAVSGAWLAATSAGEAPADGAPASRARPLPPSRLEPPSWRMGARHQDADAETIGRFAMELVDRMGVAPTPPTRGPG